jgi:hypothetical protein
MAVSITLLCCGYLVFLYSEVYCYCVPWLIYFVFGHYLMVHLLNVMFLLVEESIWQNFQCFKKTRPVGERPPHGIILRRSSIGAVTEKDHESCPPPPLCSMRVRPLWTNSLLVLWALLAPTRGSVLHRPVHLLCTQPGNQRVTFFNLSLKFAPTRIRTQDLKSAT